MADRDALVELFTRVRSTIKDFETAPACDLEELPRALAEHLGEHFGVSSDCNTRLELHYERGRYARRHVHHGPIGAKA